ncbi:hypothetical protein L2E82_25569 [Cichorium intybus]|uniref:Uncharacterized protein n=1 Tax=Cichorium intybus TaxID=13427 RepID=A0ACB9E3M0_CICIN|nr:hypothetical protein L2E82_25569 [Cichorium intybus]
MGSQPGCGGHGSEEGSGKRWFWKRRKPKKEAISIDTWRNTKALQNCPVCKKSRWTDKNTKDFPNGHCATTTVETTNTLVSTLLESFSG